ncbi:MAG: pentapeptide repeat-containing protein [Chloroflexi bacterium]|nr:pentapeptide repeat-containing protein [Chloroflexota bacterium]
MDRLKQRWKGPDGENRLHTVVRCLQGHGSLESLPFLERHENRIDLRGLPLSAPYETAHRKLETAAGPVRVHAISGRLELKGVTLSGIDFSHADLRGLVLRRIQAQDCVFFQANCRGWRTFGCRFEYVRFDKTDLREAALGGGLRRWFRSYPFNEFRFVSFRGADLRGAVFSAPLFQDCDFGSAILDGVNFSASRFVRSRFAGRLFDVHFEGRQSDVFESISGSAPRNEMQQVDFRDADIEICGFSNEIDLSNVYLPDGSFLISNMSEVMIHLGERATAIGDQDLLRAARAFVESDAQYSIISGNPFIANFKTLRGWCPDDGSTEKLLNLMRDLAQTKATYR